jgi:hypothetical protein
MHLRLGQIVKKNCLNCWAIQKTAIVNKNIGNMLSESKFACTKCPATFKFSDHKKHIS